MVDTGIQFPRNSVKARTVLAVEESSEKCVSKIIVEFDNKKSGSETRKKFPAFAKK